VSHTNTSESISIGGTSGLVARAIGVEPRLVADADGSYSVDCVRG
jgi:hypothetical protein